jgi:gluconate 2-dehydrogenase alpha chain
MTATKLKPVDAVVVGVGVAGSIICKELANAGLRVVGIERGRMLESRNDFAMPYAHDELRFEGHRSDILQNLARETLTFRNAPSETALPMRLHGSFKIGEVVGGAGIHWGGVSLRFLPWDFKTRSATEERYGKEQFPEDCTSQDWPITFDEIEPYYDQYENIYGIGGKAGNLNGVIQEGGNPFEGPRSREFPNPPTEANYAGQLFGDAAKSMGYIPWSTPTAGMTQAYTNTYRLHLGECVRGGFCTGHGCAMDAKATPITTVVPSLAKHENFELRTLCNVIRINKDSDGKRATGVTYIDARGREIEQPADIVVITSYAFNNTRLLLLSGIGKPYDPVSGTGVVGRNYAYQTTSHTRLFFDDKVFNPFMGGAALGTAIDEFNGDNFDHSGLGFVGGAFINSYGGGAPPIRVRPVPDGTPAWGSEWKKAVSKYYARNFSISAHGGCQSYRTHYLDLDPTYKDAYGLPLVRLTYDWHDNEKKMSAYLTKKSAEIGKLLNPTHMAAHAVGGKYSIVPYQSTHNTGGVVMGADPGTSVVNKYLQCWDVPNVFVVGGSAFPQNGSANPTATIGALACWAADGIKEEYLKRPGPLV